ncbi:hypothetical protein EKO04_005552 [Ascochyta lentis]|uniref:Protein kinase domain-containing protein n=1 Tax=Ascochyta lentis TaxID=205686 RepID=A0A8H7MJY6_9PLEO|nr:hypothetical protein EKO04_005552 [Ascochyta lentis]
MGNHSSKRSSPTTSNQYALRAQPRPRMRMMALSHFDHHVHRNSNKFSKTAEAFPKNHMFVKKLQKGAEGEVQEWANKRTGVLLAVKVLKREEGVEARELGFLRNLPENNFTIRCLAFFDKQPSPEDCCIVLEHCPAGDLFNFCWANAAPINNGPFSEAFMWSIFSQLANAIAFLHEGIGCKNASDAHFWRPIIHRDIKLENVLVTNPGSRADFSDINIKLSDFGMAAYYDPDAARDECFAGTPAYWAPELTWDKRLYTPASDVWAVGAAMHFLAHGFAPTQCPLSAKKQWVEENAGKRPPYRRGLSTAAQASWWAGQVAREVVPINLAIGEQKHDNRRTRPTPRYSNALNDYFGMALKMEADERPEAGKLAQYLEWTCLDFLFEEPGEMDECGSKERERRDTATSSIRGW